MDETAGGCTNFISWRNNNQWLLTVTRPNTKMVIKLSQPDARKSAGNGRHYSNAIGFYILCGNAPNAQKDQLRRKLILKSGDADDEGGATALSRALDAHAVEKSTIYISGLAVQEIVRPLCQAPFAEFVLNTYKKVFLRCSIGWGRQRWVLYLT